MKTISKKKPQGKPIERKEVLQAQEIQVSQIEPSPYNYRRYYNPTALEEFAGTLKTHGIIQPVTVRKMPSGKYELIVGYRRYLGAQIAGLKTMPCIVKEMNEAAIREAQYIENDQREDPHPMDQAQGIQNMMDGGYKLDAIAKRLSKPKAYVGLRIRLLSLIEPIREMFVADKFTMQEALRVATISADAQTDFFEKYCTKWKAEKNFKLHNLEYLLSQYRYDLRNAPFDTKDGNLLPGISACTKCPFNSATLKSLFPQDAKESVCSNPSCYNKKYLAQQALSINVILSEHVPQAILYYQEADEEIRELLKTYHQLDDLPFIHSNDVTIIAEPTKPEKDGDYFLTEDEEENDEPVFDEEAYNSEMECFEQQLQRYNELKEKGLIKKGLFLKRGAVMLVDFAEGKEQERQPTGVTAKQVYASIKGGTATPDLIEGEIRRINTRERRNKEIDRDKVQLAVYKEFETFIREPKNHTALTQADHAAIALVLIESLPYYSRGIVNELLLKEVLGNDIKPETDGDNRPKSTSEKLFNFLTTISPEQLTYLVRLAMFSKSDSKQPDTYAGYCLYRVAQDAGLNVKAIEEAQHEKMEDRQEKQREKITKLEKILKRLQRKSIQQVA